MAFEIRLKLIDPSATLIRDESWASNSEHHRRSLREHLYNTLMEMNAPGLKYQEIMALNIPPTHSHYRISISHCPDFGGYLLSSKALSVGLDLELADRVTAAAAERTSSAEAIAKAPSPAHHWAAQEASFKALSPLLSVKLQSQIHVSNWENASENTFEYSANTISDSNTSKLRGICTIRQNHVIACSFVFA